MVTILVEASRSPTGKKDKRALNVKPYVISLFTSHSMLALSRGLRIFKKIGEHLLFIIDRRERSILDDDSTNIWCSKYVDLHTYSPQW